MTYEILTVISAEVDEKGQQELSKKIQDLIKKGNGKFIEESNLGTRKLAHPMKEQETGTYLSILCDMLPEEVKKMKRQIKSQENIINTFIFKAAKIVEKKAPAAPKEEVVAEKKIVKDKPTKEKTDAKKTDTKPKKIKKTTEKPKAKVVKKAAKPEKKSEITTEIEDEENRLKKLDEKLDEILKD